MTRIALYLLCLACIIQACTTKSDQTQLISVDSLSHGFINPPNSARPRVWWHWMQGNITEDGIRKDLTWMHNSGIGGFQNFDAGLSTPQIVPKRLVYMTPEWKHAFALATHLADSLHLEMAIAGSPGWSESGGPWVAPEDGMKKLVWKETIVQGGKTISSALPAPPPTTGPFQDLPMPTGFGATNPEAKSPTYYHDVAVIAYKIPKDATPISILNPRVTSSGGKFTLDQLTDGDVAKTNLLPRDDKKGFAWIQFDFQKPTTIQAVTAVGGGDRGQFGMNGTMSDNRALEASDDGVTFHQVCLIPASDVIEQTLSMPPTTARYFRVTFKNPVARAGFRALFGDRTIPKPPAGTDIAELVLHTGPRINWAEEKAAFAPSDLRGKETPSVNDAIASADVVDITDKLGADGVLNWDAPEGTWDILRFGYSLKGTTNHPASPEATGLEVDKLDPVAVKKYFTNYLDQYKDATGGHLGPDGLGFMITDSWEAGAQNWTANLPAEFQKRRGYSMLPWLPVLTGKVIRSSKASEQFLFDFRETLSEMVAEYHYDALTQILASYGMKRYSESHESGRALIADGMDVKRKAAVPMSAMWTLNPFINQNNQTRYEADIRESASVAHIYGQNLVAAESMTALGFPNTAWSYCPENLKPTADLELASGLNRFVIHTSVHQPVDDKIPGLGLGPFGQWFTRHETWAGSAKVWTDYLARSSYLLQQGHFVADVLVYYGEDNNITSLYGSKLPDVPQGYNYDFINPDALMNLLTFSDGKYETPSGMQYKVLMLDENAKKISVPVLRKLDELVKAGGTICGVKPEATPSLADDPAEFNKLVTDIWGSNRSNVKTDKSLAQVLQDVGTGPDFSYPSESGVKLMYVHRILPGIDIYWVDNRRDSAETVTATFRQEGRMPMLWHAQTGTMDSVSYRIHDHVTSVDLNLTPDDAVFVVFGMPATQNELTLSSPVTRDLSTLTGKWQVSFQPDRGAPASATFSELKSWSDNSDPGIKYFSGTATYNLTFNAEDDWLNNGSRIILNLGDVKNLAQVSLNGVSLGTVWKKPFEVDVTKALKAGSNDLEVKVTNLWVNRLIGDQQPTTKTKITYTTMPFYQADAPLLPSGLLGPVMLKSISR